ncbi:MAG TPA: hypothetical protein VIF14_14135 [Alphaproteobacteria bacterium]|jgi:hypothetical protein
MRLRIALAALGAAAAPGAASASPQILALLSTDGPVPLHCQGAVCTAELSAFCLEKERATPATGTVYRAAPRATIVLLVTAADGSVREIDGSALAQFASLRDMTAVRVTIDRRALGDDVERIALRAGTNVSLLPAPLPNDGRPHSAAEIARATGTLRADGALRVDASPEAGVARGLARALDSLRFEDETAALWHAGAAAGAVRACAADVAAVKARRKDIIGVHGHWTGRGIVGEPSLKSCLEEAHAALMTRLNQRYWRGETPPAPAAKTAPRI